MERRADLRKSQKSGQSLDLQSAPKGGSPIDQESQAGLVRMAQQEDILSNRVPGVKFVLIVISARGIVFDPGALRQKVIVSYPDAVVFFQTVLGTTIGMAPPQEVDLIIDLTGPGERQCWFYAKKLRRMARVVIGRNAGFFRKKIYDRVFDEKAIKDSLPVQTLDRERFVQKKLFQLAGVPFLPAGEVSLDQGKSIALELPGMQRF